MAVEAATTINQLDATKPGINDLKSEGDDHIRLVKATLKATFPGVEGISTEAASNSATKLATTAQVQAAILASSGINATLPGQSGNTGKYLTTDGTTASWGALVLLGTGGVLVAAPVTLTSSSVAVQSITTTAAGQAVTLPNATTLQKGVTVFGLYNAGRYPLAVKDSAGTTLGFVDPYKHCIASLANNATAIGDWNLLGINRLAIDAYGTVTFASNVGATNTIRSVALDATRTMLLVTGSVSLHAVVYDHAASVFGTPALVRTGNIQTNKIQAVKHEVNRALVFSAVGTAMQAVLVEAIGTVITVYGSTAATFDLSGADEETARPVLVGNSWLVSGVTGVVAVTVTATSCAIGASVAFTGSNTGAVFRVSDTVALLISNNALITAKCVTVSGTTLTDNSIITLTALGNVPIYRQIGSRFAVVYNQLIGTVQGAIISVSGTTPSATTITLASPGGNTVYSAHQVANQLIVVTSNDSSFIASANALTDSIGTAVSGTAITRTLTVAPSQSYVGGNNTEGWFRYSTASNRVVYWSIGVSGNNPVVLAEPEFSFNPASGVSTTFGTPTLKSTGTSVLLMFNNRQNLCLSQTNTSFSYSFNGRTIDFIPTPNENINSANTSIESTSALWLLNSVPVTSSTATWVIYRTRLA